MSVTLRPQRFRWRPGALLGRLWAVLLTVAAGVVIGLQYIAPNKRVIPVLVAIVLFGLSLRLDMATGLGILAIALPFPRGTVFGNTNLAFVLLLLVLWLLRVTLGRSPAPRRSPVDAPLLALFIAYTISFYNVTDTSVLPTHFERFEIMVACWLMFYLIASNMVTESDFRRMLTFQAVAVALVCLVAVFELNHPGQPFIRGWIGFEKTFGTEFNTRNVRVGSTFFDYELLCEFCALNTLLALFLFLRAESAARRVAYGGLLVLVVFILFATVTRGGIVALAAGGVYLLWLVRRRLTLVATTITLGIVAALTLGMNYYVANFTRSGDVFKRLTETEFVGFIPDSRVGAWTEGWKRIFEHPLIGHGPFYTFVAGTHVWPWPHCVYLYVANNVGFVGLAVFLWLLWTLFRISRPATDDLRRAPFVQSYMIIAHVQMLVFIVDEIKIEYLRNIIYQFQVWMMFALIAAAYQTAHPAAVAARAAAREPRPAHA